MIQCTSLHKMLKHSLLKKKDAKTMFRLYIPTYSFTIITKFNSPDCIPNWYNFVYLCCVKDTLTCHTLKVCI